MGQTTYYDVGGLPQGLPGQLFDITDTVIDTYVNAEASAKIPPGVMVKKGTNDYDAKLPTTNADDFAGIALHTHGVPVDFGSFAQGMSTTGYDPGVAISVLKRGRCWVITEEAVTQDDGAFVRYAAGAGGTQLGAFRKSADTATAVDVSKKVRFLKSQSTVNGIVPVSVDMLNS